MERETRTLITQIEEHLFDEAKNTYLHSSKNSAQLKELLFRTWLKTVVQRENGSLKERVRENFVDILKHNDEFKALANLKEDEAQS